MPARFEDVTTDTRRGVPRDLGGHYDGDCQIRDDICITGFSGRLPESSNIDEFKRNLMEGVDMVTDSDHRWAKNLYDLPARSGKIKDDDLQNLDAEFFKIHQKQAEGMDPQLRMLLECTYEAIIDAGKFLLNIINLFSIKHKNARRGSSARTATATIPPTAVVHLL